MSRISSAADHPLSSRSRRPRRTTRTRPRRGAGIRSAVVAAGSALLLSAGLFFGGFLGYVQEIATLAEPHRTEADGIVVLTGGSDRVAGAVDLLQAGRAQRLLISGVHPHTSAHQIGRVVDASTSLFDCCVDLDRRAENTIGNAAETAKWARSNAFRSLIVVTSAYHMPRSLAELGSAMPEVDLIAYPVASNRLGLDRWWTSTETVRLLLEEYLKYTASRARLAITGSSGGALPQDGGSR